MNDSIIIKGKKKTEQEKQEQQLLWHLAFFSSTPGIIKFVQCLFLVLVKGISDYNMLLYCLFV